MVSVIPSQALVISLIGTGDIRSVVLHKVAISYYWEILFLEGKVEMEGLFLK